MKYALVGDERIEATPGCKGTCPGCGDPVIAKCGKQKIEHWAHKGAKTCDPWWESETEWHRAWKAHFLKELQEVRHQNPETEEWHIADVKLAPGIVLEFQHSAIKHEEIKSREEFYAEMIWIVDATRLKRSVGKIKDAFAHGDQWDLQGHRAVTHGLNDIPLEFRESRHCVLFDCGPNEPFYCILPGRVLDAATLIAFNRDSIIERLKSGSHFVDAKATQERLLGGILALANKYNIPPTMGLKFIIGYWVNDQKLKIMQKRMGPRGLLNRR